MGYTVGTLFSIMYSFTFSFVNSIHKSQSFSNDPFLTSLENSIVVIKGLVNVDCGHGLSNLFVSNDNQRERKYSFQKTVTKLMMREDEQDVLITKNVVLEDRFLFTL